MSSRARKRASPPAETSPATSEDPRHCGALNRRGEPCRRWKLLDPSSPGGRRPRCRLHGGSTPPKSGNDLDAARTQRIISGARTQLETVLKLVEADLPAARRRELEQARSGAVEALEAIASADGTKNLAAELRLARELLALSELAAARRDLELVGPQLELLRLIRKLAMAQQRASPGAACTGLLEVALKVVGEAPAAEAERSS